MSNYSFFTFGNIVDEAGDELSVDIDSTSFPGLTRANMEKWANRYCKNFISKVDLKTQEGTYSFVSVADTTLSAAASSGAVSLTITSASGWPASGLAVIDDVPMTFTRSSTTLTVTATTRAFESGAEVQLAYSVPSDFLRPRSMFVEGAEYIFARRGDTLNVKPGTVSLYGDYFVLPKSTGAALGVTIHYTKKGTNTLTTGNNMEIMDYFDSYVIAMLTSRGHRIMYDEDRAISYEKEADTVLRMAKSHFAKADGSRIRAFIPAF